MRKLKKSSVKKRSNRAEGSERVIREDGSEAIKVKSKKRRSIQPRKEKEKKSNKRKVILIAVTVALLLMSVIAFSVLLGYYNGNVFKSKVTETIVNASGAEVELGKLDVSPATAKLSKIDLSWSGKDTLIKTLKIKGVNADYGMLGFVGGGWGGSAVGIDQANITLQMRKNNPTLNTTLERPVDFKFGLYRCSELNINFGKDSLWSFKKGSLSHRVSEESDYQFSIDSGDFKVPKFGNFKVQAGLVSFAADRAQLYLGLMSEDQKGSLSVDGTLGYNQDSAVDLKTELRDYPLRDWIDPRARRFFNGEIQSGKGVFKMKLGDTDSFDITTTITSRLIRVNNFEFIKTLSEHLQEEYYRKPDFVNESKMMIKWTKGRIEFSDIDLRQDTQMRIRGNFTIDKNNQMSGKIKVGLPVMVISTKRGKALNKVFNENDGEYIWANIIITGKATAPEDNLDEMLQNTSAEEKEVKGDEDGESFELKFKKLTE